MSKVIAIGNFDGVHRGHQAILGAARRMAGDSGTVVALTFWPHPVTVLQPDTPLPLLCDIEDRVSLLRSYGADEVSIVEFTRAVAAWSPVEFIEKILGPLGPTAVVVGENFRFGAGAKADGRQMAALVGEDFGVCVLPMLCDGGPVSSSRIRAAIAAGDPRLAGQMLGRWFRYSGIVMLGDQRGRTLGFPTANLAVPPTKACVADGVYAGYLSHGGARWPAAISVGTNPTFDGLVRRVEAHGIDAPDLKLYGDKVGVDFVAHLRGQTRFDSREALVAQMRADVAAVRAAVADADMTLGTH